jgi:deoxycytidine triphosphate deaminase
MEESGMKLLKDDQLVSEVTGAAPIVTGHGYTDDWYAKFSPIQACSIDLTVGDIFLPGSKREESGGESAPLARYNLRPGQTAIVTTREEIHLSSNLAAIGFPPSRVSFKGILMTNPGHVDPGYVGRLRFTLINMGSQQYPLERGVPIVTLLVVELSSHATRDWPTRGNAAPAITQGNIDILSSDFLDVERRAEEISNKAVSKATFRAIYISAIVPVVGALLGLFATIFMPPWGRQLETDVKVLKESLSVEKTQNRIEKLEEELKVIKAATCRQSPRPGYCEPPGSAVPATPKKPS